DRATRALSQVLRTLETLNRLTAAGRFAQLDPTYRQQVQSLLFEQYRAYRNESVDDPGLRLQLARAAYRIARLIENKVSSEEALAAWREAGDLFADLAHDEPEDLEVLKRLGIALGQQGDLLRRLGRAEEARAALLEARDRARRASELARSMLAHDP